MMSNTKRFSELLHGLSQTGDEQWSASIAENWMQGRTTYGGLSTALCLKSALNSYPNLPSLRSAQINFIGPVGGSVTLNTRVMRQGRSVAVISVDLIGEKGLAVNAVFSFAQSRESKLDCYFTPTPKQPSYDKCAPFLDTKLAPAFLNNFECRIAHAGQPFSGSTQSEQHIWARHKDKKANDLFSLVGIADMSPPAVLPMFKEIAPTSSMTWMFNILSENINTEDGWWLLRSSAEHAQHGYSSQDMQVWNSDSELVISGRQNVAIFY